MKVIFLSKFSKDIDKIKLQAVRDDIIATISEIENATKIADIKNLKKLVGFKTAYRIRIGDRCEHFLISNIRTYATLYRLA